MIPHSEPGTNGHGSPARPAGRRVKVFDFFSGCGGASQGFRDAGMDVVFALDWDRDAGRTFQQNFPRAQFESRDIRDVSVDAVRQLVDRQRPHYVLFCGCAPCQPFTRQKTTRPDPDADERVSLLLQFLRFIRRCEPDIVFVENVPGIQTLQSDSEPLSTFKLGLKDAGYWEPAVESVQLKRYGVPQSRRRLLLLASRRRKLELPPETHGPGTENPDFVTVRDAIGHLPAIAAGETHPDVPEHRAAKLSPRNLERIRITKADGGHRYWPERLRLKCHRKHAGHTDVYGRMWWEKPASGLTTRCISYSNGRFGHPEQDRAISVREAACLQTFPEKFRFYGNLNSMARQIGNAVPVKLTEVMGRHVMRHLANGGGS